MPKKRVKRHAVVQPLNTSYRLIPLTHNQNAIVDASDFEWLNQNNWGADWNPHTKSFYAKRAKRINGKRTTVHMSREILKCKQGEQVDHRDGNTLNNRKRNLRPATTFQNCCNQGMRSNNTTGYKGVYFRKEFNMWVAMIGHQGKLIYLGIFRSAEKAARVRDKAAIKLHGEFARLNFTKHIRSS